MPSWAAALHTSTGSPTGSSAATRSSCRVAGGSGARRSEKVCSIRVDNAASVGQPEPAGQLGRRPATWQPEQRQRVPAGLRHNPITHALVKRTGDYAREQLTRITIIQPAHDELRQPLKVPLADWLAHGEDQPERLGTPRRRPTNANACAEAGRATAHRPRSPAAVLSSATSGEQTQNRQADEEPIRRIAVAQNRTQCASASRCGPGRRSSRSRNGAHNWCNPAYAAPSPTRPRPLGRDAHPDACSTR